MMLLRGMMDRNRSNREGLCECVFNGMRYLIFFDSVLDVRKKSESVESCCLYL